MMLIGNNNDDAPASSILNNGGEGNVSDLHHQDRWASAKESYAISNNNEP